MTRFEFVGGDPIHSRRLGPVEPGDVLDLDEPPDPVNWRPAAPLQTDLPTADTETAADAPDSSQED